MIKLDFKRKWANFMFAGMVLVFAVIQVYWLFANDASIMHVLSIFTSIGLFLVLIILAISRREKPIKMQGEIKTDAVKESLPFTSVTIGNVDADEYFYSIKNELDQAERLVSDAVNNLVLNFNYISKLTSAHHNMVLAIEKMAAPADNKPILKLLRRQMETADKIEQELAAAVTSLQFGDLVTQLLNHTTNQVDELNLALQRIDRKSNSGSRGKSLDEIHHGISKAVVAAKEKNKRKPVVQQGMGMGEVELF
ncbi:MAG: hypothetical protein Q8K59_05695 [Nitrosomonas sp.]|nr:hypothetical protein [Nitrosomonas sp.]MDP1950576.1 hypothetical protein [Nitrosomonas sp.]